MRQGVGRMKQEMFEFILHTQGFDIPTLNMRAPHGATVYGPKKLPFMDRPYMEGYKTYPELSRRGGPLTYGLAASVGIPLVVALPFVTATAHYPDVAGPQYQSALSGQMGIGSSALSMRKPTSIREVFTWEYWQGY